MEKLTKENIYIDLRGKSKEELTELYNFLESVGEKHFRETLNDFLANIKYFETYIFHKDIWSLAPYVYILNKTKVTIQQLKEILQPMETLQQKEQRLLKELEEVRKEIEDSKIKFGDWVKSDCNHIMKYYDWMVFSPNWIKITNPELIKLLEQEIK